MFGKVTDKVRRGFDSLADMRRCAHLKAAGPSRGAVLISYIYDPFRDRNLSDNLAHTNVWEVQEMARTFLEDGYDVDVIDYHNWRFKPARRDYDFFIDSRFNMERLDGELDRSCIRIHHADTSHIVAQNYEECRRILELQQRRSVTVLPRRQEVPNLAIEHADCATVIGNETTLATFRYANKPLYALPVPAGVKYDWPEHKDFQKASRNFLWFGSGGLVRKGLDLALDAFAGMPDVHLHVCGPIAGEADFARAYERELLHTPNIHLHGWVDVSSASFLSLLNDCAAIVFPSCSEGQAGSVATAMQAGLLPLVSMATGFDVGDFGTLLHSCSVDEIRQVVLGTASLPPLVLSAAARRTWEIARTHYTRENYSVVYRQAIASIKRRFGTREPTGTARSIA